MLDKGRVRKLDITHGRVGGGGNGGGSLGGPSLLEFARRLSARLERTSGRALGGNNLAWTRGAGEGGGRDWRGRRLSGRGHRRVKWDVQRRFGRGVGTVGEETLLSLARAEKRTLDAE